MKFHVYKNKKLAEKGETLLDGPHLINQMINRHKLGFEDKVRIVHNDDSQNPLWFEVINAEIDGIFMNYRAIDLDNPQEVSRLLRNL